MFKIISKSILLLSIILLFSCQDDDSNDGINGTFKLRAESWNCEGSSSGIKYEEIQFMTINDTKLDLYDDLADDCSDWDNSGSEDCYEHTKITATRDGNFLTYKEGPPESDPKYWDEYKIFLSLSGDVLKVEFEAGGDYYYDKIDNKVLSASSLLPNYNGKICN